MLYDQIDQLNYTRKLQRPGNFDKVFCDDRVFCNKVFCDDFFKEVLFVLQSVHCQRDINVYYLLAYLLRRV